MSETPTLIQANLPRPRFVLLCLFVWQLLIAIVVAGLAAYGLHYVMYNVLVYSLIVAICTIVVCVYFVVSHYCIKSLYSGYITVAYHIWMVIFWAIDVGLFSHLAHLWQEPNCSQISYKGYECAPDARHDRGTISGLFYDRYHGALIAGAVLASFELIFWVLSVFLTFRNLRKGRLGDLPPSQNANTCACPPQVTELEQIELHRPQTHDESLAYLVELDPASHSQAPWAYLRREETARTGPIPVIPDDSDGDRYSEEENNDTRREFREHEVKNVPHSPTTQKVEHRVPIVSNMSPLVDEQDNKETENILWTIQNSSPGSQSSIYEGMKWDD